MGFGSCGSSLPATSPDSDGRCTHAARLHWDRRHKCFDRVHSPVDCCKHCTAAGHSLPDNWYSWLDSYKQNDKTAPAAVRQAFRLRPVLYGLPDPVQLPELSVPARSFLPPQPFQRHSALWKRRPPPTCFPAGCLTLRFEYCPFHSDYT